MILIKRALTIELREPQKNFEKSTETNDINDV
jgi:hypothetical protein